MYFVLVELWRRILGYILVRCDGMVWAGLVWLRIGTGGWLL
jgi:hypothetical protein